MSTNTSVSFEQDHGFTVEEIMELAWNNNIPPTAAVSISPGSHIWQTTLTFTWDPNVDKGIPYDL